jgi:hypothetical protein
VVERTAARAYRCRQARYACTARSICGSDAPEAPAEPRAVEPEETVPPAEAPDGVVTLPDADGELTPPDVDGELTLPVAGELTVLPEGELVLTPVPLVAPVLGAPDAPVLECVLLLIEPEAPVPDVVGDADGLPETPAACIACWLHRSKSARVTLPWPMAMAGSRTAPIAADEVMILATLVM